MENTEPDRDFMDYFVASQASVYGYIRAMVINGADAEELFQQVAMTLWSKRDSFDATRGSFQAWAIGVARNHVRNFSRHKTVDNRTQVFSTEIVDRIAECRSDLDATWDERQEALSSCLTKLKATDRAWLEDFYGGIRKPRQIAKDEGVSLRTFYRKVQKLRKTLLDCIFETVGPEADNHARS